MTTSTSTAPSPVHAIPVHQRLPRVCAVWPDLWPEWQQNRFRPVKRGIAQDIRRWLKENPAAALTGRDITLVLQYVTSRLSYLTQLTTGAARVGLDGRPAEAVSDRDVAYADKKAAEVRAKIDSARKKKNAAGRGAAHEGA